MNLDEAKQKLIAAGRILEAEGQGDLTRGHVSVRVPRDPSLFLMKPHSHGFGEITEDNIVICSLDGEKVGGRGRRHSEVFIHSEIFKVRPDVNSVIHTHPTYAVALSATGRPLLPISQPGVTFSDGLPYYTETVDLIRTPEMGAGVARALGACKATLMRNHGVFTVGPSARDAVKAAVMCEDVARTVLLARTLGEPTRLDQADIDALYQRYQNVYGQREATQAAPEDGVVHDG